jgi:2-polyprenyl-6-methoxyphenol hydroxylase-like FAD-dependent oxidoreductase
MSIFDPNRELIVKHKFLLGDERIPAVCALSRLRLHEILLAAAQRAGVEVSLGVTISEIHEDNDRVTVDFSNGQTESFDLLAGFDGIRSATRLHLVGTAFGFRGRVDKRIRALCVSASCSARIWPARVIPRSWTLWRLLGAVAGQERVASRLDPLRPVYVAPKSRSSLA